MAVEIERHRFSIADYHAMIERGILTERDRVELIAGEVVEMPPIGPPHGGCVKFLAAFFIERLKTRATVSVQDTILLPPDSQPQPDIALLHPRSDFYSHELPYQRDVYLIVEVADSTLRFDRLVKLPLYGKTGIPEVWIVNVNEQTVEVHTEPTEIGYARRQVVRLGETLAPLAFADVVLHVDDLPWN